MNAMFCPARLLTPQWRGRKGCIPRSSPRDAIYSRQATRYELLATQTLTGLLCFGERSDEAYAIPVGMWLATAMWKYRGSLETPARVHRNIRDVCCLFDLLQVPSKAMQLLGQLKPLARILLDTKSHLARLSLYEASCAVSGYAV